MRKINFIIIILFLILLSSFVSAKEFVYVTMNGAKLGGSINLNLEQGKPYTFYSYGSSGIDKIVSYVKGENVRNEGKTTSITFTPTQAKTYELDIIGFQTGRWAASQKFYLKVGGTEISTSETEEDSENELEEPCQENWQCTKWSECIGNKQTMKCSDVNKCGTTINKPIEQKNCDSDVEDEQEVDEEQEKVEKDKEVKEQPKEDCGTYNADDFFSVCEYIKCKKETYIYDINEQSRVKIGFAKTKEQINPNSYSSGLTNKDIAVIYNLFNDKVYVYYGKEVNRVQVASTIKSMEAQFANDACSAFYSLIENLKDKEEVKNIKPAKTGKNENVVIFTTSEVLSSLGKVYGQYETSLKNDNYNPTTIILDDSRSVRRCDPEFDETVRPPIPPEFSMKVMKACNEKFSADYALILGGHNDIQQLNFNDIYGYRDSTGRLIMYPVYSDILLFVDRSQLVTPIPIGRIPRGIDKDSITIKNYLMLTVIPSHNTKGLKKSIFDSRYAWLMNAGEVEQKKTASEHDFGYFSQEILIHMFFGGKFCKDNPNCDLSPQTSSLKMDFIKKPNLYLLDFHGNGEGLQGFSDESTQSVDDQMTPEIAASFPHWRNSIVISEGCYAARIHNVNFEQSIALNILSKGAIAYLGETDPTGGTLGYDNIALANKDNPEKLHEFFEESNVEQVSMNYAFLKNLKDVDQDTTLGKLSNDAYRTPTDVFYGDPTIRIRYG